MNKKPPFYNPLEQPDQYGNTTDAYGYGSAAQHKANDAYAAQDGSGLPSFASGAGVQGGLFPEDNAYATAEGIPGVLEVPVLTDDELAEQARERICPLCPVKKEADDAHLRALADLDNARKRLAREKEEFVRFANERVLGDILPSLDNLDLALQHVANNDTCKDFAIGVEMTKRLLLDSLKTHGLEVVGTVGEAFDPAVHEAVGTAQSADVPEDHIASLLAHGYSLHGRLLRPAKVLVSKN